MNVIDYQLNSMIMAVMNLGRKFIVSLQSPDASTAPLNCSLTSTSTDTRKLWSSQIEAQLQITQLFATCAIFPTSPPLTQAISALDSTEAFPVEHLIQMSRLLDVQVELSRDRFPVQPHSVQPPTGLGHSRCVYISQYLQRVIPNSPKESLG